MLLFGALYLGQTYRQGRKRQRSNICLSLLTDVLLPINQFSKVISLFHRIEWCFEASVNSLCCAITFHSPLFSAVIRVIPITQLYSLMYSTLSSNFLNLTLNSCMCCIFFTALILPITTVFSLCGQTVYWYLLRSNDRGATVTCKHTNHPL